MVFRDPDSTKCTGTWTASAARVMALSESFFEPLVASLPVQALRGLPCLGSFSVVWGVRHIEGPPLAGVVLFSLAHQSWTGAPWV